MRTWIAVVVAVSTAVAGSALAFGSQPADSAATNEQLAKRVKKLERRVNALARLQLLDRRRGVEVTVERTLGRSLGNGFYYGTATCSSGSVVGGGVEFPANPYGDDHALDSHPFGGGWYAMVESRAGYPWIYATCVD